MGALNTLSAVEAARQIAAGKITSEALVRDCLEHIAAREIDVQAWEYLDCDGALKQARAADAGPPLLDMHAKDLRDLKDKDSQCIVGEGKIPIVALFRQLEKMRYAGYVNLEYEIDENDPMPGMKQSFAYMRGVLAGLAT